MNELIIYNPATEDVLVKLEPDNLASLQEKYNWLKEAQPLWYAIGLDKRVTVVKRFAELLAANKKELSEIVSSETGKPIGQAINEIKGAIARIAWMTTNAEQYLKDEVMTAGSDIEEKISYEPLGVICNISAWNYPYLVGVNVFVPALLAGNAVLYKPSEFATLTGLQIEKLWREAGLPVNTFHIAVGDGKVGALLLDMPFAGYFFTGSYKTGKLIYEKVATKMVPCQCELGGKDPLYVTEDVQDIKQVAIATADGAFYNNGQSCCAVERIYVQEKVYDDYVAAFVQEVASWKVGLPAEEGVYIGPLTRKEQLSVLQMHVQDAIAKGAVLLAGGEKIDRQGNFFQPTILTNVSHEMLVMQEESFGPIIGIMKVKSDEEAIALMRDTEYGLTAAVYSTNEKRAKAILQQVDAGTGYWNCCDRVSAAVPWSGRKHSGFGATLSHSGLRTFTKPKAYHLKKG